MGRKIVDTTASICMLVLLWCAAQQQEEDDSSMSISKHACKGKLSAADESSIQREL
jgi:hypothetical protein